MTRNPSVVSQPVACAALQLDAAKVSSRPNTDSWPLTHARSVAPATGLETTKYSPPDGQFYPRLLGELAPFTPISNAQRLATYQYKAALSGKVRWFRALPGSGRKS